MYIFTYYIFVLLDVHHYRDYRNCLNSPVIMFCSSVCAHGCFTLICSQYINVRIRIKRTPLL